MIQTAVSIQAERAMMAKSEAEIITAMEFKELTLLQVSHTRMKCALILDKWELLLLEILLVHISLFQKTGLMLLNSMENNIIIYFMQLLTKWIGL